MKLILPYFISTKRHSGVIRALLTGITAGLMLLINLTSHAQTLNTSHSHQEIRQAAKKFLEEKQVAADIEGITISIGKVDPRLRLVQCTGDIVAFAPQSIPSRGRTTIGVQCEGVVAWKVLLTANIQIFQNVWVARRFLSANDLITSADVSQQKVDITNMRKVPIENLELILNTSPKRSMRPGAIIYQDSICMVCRGERVAITAKNEFLSIQVEGIALTDASIGETAQIRNSKSKRVFGAIVTGKNQLSVRLSATN